MAVKKWTQAKSITISDYNQKINEHAKRNCVQNDCKDVEIKLINWT